MTTMLKRLSAFFLASLLMPIGQPGLADTLQGGVAIQRVSRLQLEGSVFSPESLPKEHTTRNWQQIPSWLAGSWQREFETVSAPLPLLGAFKFQSKRSRTWGHEVDSKGNIWHANDLPSVGKVESQAATTYMIVTSLEPIETSEKAVTMRCITTNISVDKVTGIIKRTFQQENVQTYSPAGGDKLMCREKIRTFDQDGKQTHLGPSPDKFEDKRTAPFQSVPMDDPGNYYPDFCQYLQSIGHPELIPPGQVPWEPTDKNTK